MKAVLRILLVAMIVMISVSACGPSPEELYNQGVEYYNNKEYTKAMECFTKAAKKGHSYSEKYIAMIIEGKTPDNTVSVTKNQTRETVEIEVDDIDDEIYDEDFDEIEEQEEVVYNETRTKVEKQAEKKEKQVAKKEKPAVKDEKPAMKSGSGFSVSDSKSVYFAKGNLQYNPATHQWRLAENQWDVIGDANKNLSDKYNGWIDLFGWGTGNNPTNNSTNNKDYDNFSDWGKNNISNGGGNKWRTLSKDEWEYVFDIRNTPSGIRFAKASVNGVKGVILLPDNWNSSYYELDNTNRSGANFDDNTVSKSDWNTKLAAYGAVFLPNAGSRKASEISGIGKDGYYWSSTNYDSSGAFAVYIYDRNVNSAKHYYHKNGFSVRLVR